jgi:hypothetical protein
MSFFNEVKVLDDGGDLITNPNPFPVVLESNSTVPLDLYFIQTAGTPTTLLAATAVDDRTITLTSTTGFVDGTFIGIFDPISDRFYFGEQVGAPAGNVITLDTPLDFAFDAGKNVLPFSRDLNVDGSSTPQTFSITVGGGDLSIEITRIIISMVHNSSGDDGKFGGGAALPLGLVLRYVNGDTRNIFNTKSNSDFANLAYDVSYTTRSVPGNSYGTRIRYTLGGQDKHDSSIKLLPGESLQAIVQDDLTLATRGLISFRMIAAGRISSD